MPGALAAKGDLGAFLLADVDVGQHALHLAFIDHRAHRGLGIERILRAPLLGMLGDEFDELVLDLLLDDDAGRRGADLAGIVEDAARGRRSRLIHVGDIGEDDVGRLAAGFERDMLHVALAGIAQEVLADFGRAGEGDHVDIHMAAERLAGGFAKARKHVEHAFGNAGFSGQFGNADGRQRRLLGRLQDDGIAGGKRRSKLPRRHQQGEVPRHHGADDADRLARDHRNRVGPRRSELVIDLVGSLGIPLDAADRGGQVSTGSNWRWACPYRASREAQAPPYAFRSAPPI